MSTDIYGWGGSALQIAPGVCNRNGYENNYMRYAGCGWGIERAGLAHAGVSLYGEGLRSVECNHKIVFTL